MAKYLLLTILMTGLQAHAFQLGDHDWIVHQAYQEFTACYPEFKAQLNVDWLVEGDLGEDLNFITKELRFSHYYNPNHKLKMWRESSADRVINLKPELLQCRSDARTLTYDDTIALGEVLHHYQDMAVPAHVVPVAHSFWDGFENFKVSDGIESGWNCAQIAAAAQPFEDILQQTALSTLKNVQAWTVETVDSSNQAKTFSGVAFWRESGDENFGSYGELGNNFGAAKISVDGQDYALNGLVFTQFKQQQMQLAVRASLQGLVSALVAQSGRN